MKTKSAVADCLLMHLIRIPIWKKAPFLRLLLPLIVGILLQWYFHYEPGQIISTGCCFTIAFLLFQLLPFSFRFKLQALQGLLLNVIIVACGLLLNYQNDIRHQQNWFGNYYHDTDYLVVTINEPLQEKSKTFKSDALVENIVSGNTTRPVTGKIILYFLKDSNAISLNYGDKIIINKKLQAVQNPGNPGSFDYRQYLAFKQIFHTVFLKNGEWVLLPEKHINYLNRFLFTARQNILNVLHRNMQGEDDQLSIAEALLIGYTQDLDKDLVQAYSNTGVVHIIAISGMHLGLIYIILIWLFKKIPYIKRSGIIKIIFVLSCLWLFALLTGGGASILRSAVMFSFIVIGENFAKKTSIYNSLAASAFLLLCYNPNYLWDAGFQLSYLALTGIVICQKPIYNLVFIKSAWPDKIWQLTAVSLAAQVFTFPICLYYFHQFPTIFLFTNLITVPLSTIILFVEIFLIALAWVPFVGVLLGRLTWCLIWLMNKIILFFNGLPYALWNRIPATVTSTIVLYTFVASAAFWLLNKNKTAFKMSLFALFAFAGLHTFSKWNTARQQKIIVYNIPQRQAIDFVDGNDYLFVGDSILRNSNLLQNIHIKPARIAMQLRKEPGSLKQLSQKGHFFLFRDKAILLIDSLLVFEPLKQRINIDLIIISGNPNFLIAGIAATFNCKQYIFDASNSLWKIGKWKQECQLLHLPFYSVPEKGAFIKDL